MENMLNQATTNNWASLVGLIPQVQKVGTYVLKTHPRQKNVHGNVSSPQNTNTADKKRERPSELVYVSVQNNWNQELSDAMAKAITEVIASSGLRTATLPQIDKKNSQLLTA
ncbi:L10-interacting MYB domain-containing protein-like [Forsythia ovata]|uniref:L10-interacting MYB domain-containing protein-like n=1 Tax=Forsythia ovata TaxID=205694 RepID=A0ABD1NX01_9LAMI